MTEIGEPFLGGTRHTSRGRSTYVYGVRSLVRVVGLGWSVVSSTVGEETAGTFAHPATRCPRGSDLSV